MFGGGMSPQQQPQMAPQMTMAQMTMPNQPPQQFQQNMIPAAPPIQPQQFPGQPQMQMNGVPSNPTIDNMSNNINSMIAGVLGKTS
jgi:hypothetical protein